MSTPPEKLEPLGLYLIEFQGSCGRAELIGRFVAYGEVDGAGPDEEVPLEFDIGTIIEYGKVTFTELEGPYWKAYR